MGKYMGIDYGSKKIGIALSDEGGMIAFPYEIFAQSKNNLEEIAALAAKEGVTEFVIGESLDQNGTENKINEAIKMFAQKLEQLNLPVHFEKEFMTSHHASGADVRRGKLTLAARKTKIKSTGSVDAAAAALILQRFLDRNKMKE